MKRAGKLLVVVDMQHDFIDGALGTPEARRILPRVTERVRAARLNGETVVFTRDTHEEDYLSTQEGKRMPRRALCARHARLAACRRAGSGGRVRVR